MTTIKSLGAALLPAVLVCGCSNLNNTENGALAGGGIGAATGALIGQATGHTAGGALIGAGVGALTGGLVGNAVDNSEKKAAAAAAQRRLGLVDIVQMTQSHISDELIIQDIRTTGSVFTLSAQDTIWLRQSGVSEPVIAEMMATATRYPRYSAVYGEPVYVEPAPVVGVGFGYRWR
jgi:outer membrane protein with glycine zipper